MTSMGSVRPLYICLVHIDSDSENQDTVPEQQGFEGSLPDLSEDMELRRQLWNPKLKIKITFQTYSDLLKPIKT